MTSLFSEEQILVGSEKMVRKHEKDDLLMIYSINTALEFQNSLPFTQVTPDFSTIQGK